MDADLTAKCLSEARGWLLKAASLTELTDSKRHMRVMAALVEVDCAMNPPEKPLSPEVLDLFRSATVLEQMERELDLADAHAGAGR